MKIQCPNCKTEYRVDEEKIPIKGAYTRCKTCRNRFFVQKEIESKRSEPGMETAGRMTAEEARVDQHILQGDPEAAARLLSDLIKRYAKEKNFIKAEALRDKLYQDVPLALDTIVKAGEIIEEEKRKLMDPKHLEVWRNLYESLTPDETIELYFSMNELILKPGQKVFEQGQRNSNLYFVQSGLLKLSYVGPVKQEEVFLKELSVGDVANADAFLSATLCAHTLVALAETKLTYLEKDILTKWKEKFPGIKAKLSHFCRHREDIKELIQKEKLHRRAHERVKISLRATVQLLDVSDQAKKMPFRVTIDDISAGGFSYIYRLSNEAELDQLLGHHLAMQIDCPTPSGEEKIAKRGKIVAAHLLPFGECAIHVRFQTLLDDKIIESMKELVHGD